VSPYEGIKNRAGNAVQVLLAEGDDTAAAASKADVTVVVAALTPGDEGEFTFVTGGDRTNLRLHEEDEQLIEAACKASKKCVVLMEAGSAIIVEPWIDQADGLVMAWYPGQEGGNAIADVLFGNYNPSGKLPVTFGKSEDQYPPQLRNAIRATYGYYHGYRYIDKNNLEPRYEFGYGLSYTTFDYGNMNIDKLWAAKLDTINVSFDLTNSGGVDGNEVAQLYVGFENSKIDRPIKELKGFKRVALAPGETKLVTIPIKVEDLAYYNVDRKAWEVESIQYNVYIGASSKDIRLKGEFSVN
jgi:beta-glucosidase